ncbi:hypothetical protein [Ferrimonas sp. YFM]|uniref:hypothetical protein n=1 Tax=Ferrimonas sp. YFM TaxID=3028878 RepID=UPI0025748B29|nr:hypothetical protein [Ferrimonas sp. YFM]BDY04879.1 hypothetical protein F0521_19200 [Ferrimonas sp. YFM]
MKTITTALLCAMSFGAFAADPFTSVYQQSTKDTSAFDKSLAGSDIAQGRWAFFEFAETDSLFGSLSAGQAGDSQQLKFNAINYYLWFGGRHKLPFQLYYSDVVSDDSNKDANTVKLLDPESGLAIKFPLLWTYQSAGDEFCAFLSDTNSIGHCSLGGDITLSFKDLKEVDGNSETAFGATVRLGAAVLFPVLAADTGEASGYLSTSVKLVFAHTDVDDSTQLFAPVLDENGDPVAFDNDIFSAEAEIKWAFTNRLAISARWLAPLDDHDYIDDIFKLSLETQF